MDRYFVFRNSDFMDRYFVFQNPDLMDQYLIFENPDFMNWYFVFQNPDKNAVETGPDATLASHVVCFAAERARKENRVLIRNEEGLFV